jgi:hypothetical protein
MKKKIGFGLDFFYWFGFFLVFLGLLSYLEMIL